MKKKYIAPNVITAGNMFLGYLSIIESIKGNYMNAVIFIILAMVCDGLDGLAARKFDAFSEFGKEFDSFSDAISFGIAPSILIYSIFSKLAPNAVYIMPVAFFYALCGVVRLVKFNVVTEASAEKSDFSGMPIPNGAGLICSYYLITNAIKNHLGYDFFDVQTFMAISILSGFLMISTIPFKTPAKTFSFIPKKFIIIVLLASVFVLQYSLFVFCFGYVLINIISLLQKRIFKKNKKLNIDEDEDEYEYDNEEEDEIEIEIEEEEDDIDEEE